MPNFKRSLVEIEKIAKLIYFPLKKEIVLGDP